jgi:hypothetical protein
MPRILVVILTAALGLTAGCGKKSIESLVQEREAIYAELTTALEEVKDDASAEKALPNIERMVEKHNKNRDAITVASRSISDQDRSATGKYAKQAEEDGPKMLEIVTKMGNAFDKAIRLAPKHGQRLHQLMLSMASNQQGGRG